MDGHTTHVRARGWPIGSPSPVPLPGTVAAVMSSPLLTMDASASLEQGASQMQDAGTHHLLLTDRGLIVAMVSDRNVIRALGVGRTSRNTEEWVRRHPMFQVAAYHLVTVEETTRVEDAAATMLAHDVSALPVVNEAAEVVGIVTSRDLLRWLAERGRASPPEVVHRYS